MRIFKIVFSPTGGTRKVADMLADGFCAREEQQMIDLCEFNCDFSGVQLNAGDLAIIAMPAFGGRVPALADKRLAQIKADGAYAVLAAVYGNRAIDDTMIEMYDIACAAGFKCIAGVSALAEHTLAHEYAAGRPNSDDAKELAGFAARIAEKIRTGANDMQVPGKRPYKDYGGGPARPVGNENCTGCGLCAEKCPAGAIPAENPAGIDAAKCISCMRCVAVCPVGARQADAALLGGIAEKIRPLCSGRKENALFID